MDTIAAISTPAGSGGLGVIRISGGQAVSVAEKIFRSFSGRRLEALAGYTALYGHAYDGDGDIDECVALVFRAPRSYTGEDVVELSCHGGTYILRRVLRAAFTAGARSAAAGEFTRRAFLNGKLDLTQAESVMDLIAADGRLSARIALSSREGAVYRKIEQVKGTLLGAAANLSAFVDYPDDEIPELSPAALSSALLDAENILVRLLESYDAGRILREGVDTVIAGSPNVGKSTLMNALAGCERSIVTDIPGTTRDVVEETIRLGEVTLKLADTAGIRDTNDTVEQIGVERAKRRMDTAELVLAVFDASRALSDNDREIARQAVLCPSIAVVNKSDLGCAMPSRDTIFLESIFRYVVTISAQNGDGVDALRQAVEKVTGINHIDGSAAVLGNERQRDCVMRCLGSIREAIEALDAGMTLDAAGVCIDDAVSALLELTGERATEAVVNEIFARFCVGK